MNLPPLSALRESPARRGTAASSPTPWGYIRHELLFLSYALMEIALITPVTLVILGWARYWPAYLVAGWLALIMLLPLNLIRLMSLLHYDLRRQRRVLIGGLLVTILVSWRTLLYDAGALFDFGWLRMFADSLGEGANLLWTRDLSIFLVTAFMWWRGIRLAIRQPEINNMGLRLRLGGLILLPMIVWFGGGFLGARIVPFILLFFLAALTAVSLVRAETIEQEQSGTSATLNTRWFLVVFGAALAVVLVAGVVGAFIAGDSLFTVMAWLSPLWRALQFGATVAGHILYRIAYPGLEAFGYVVQLLSRIFASLFGMFAEGIGLSDVLQDPMAPEIATPTPDAGAGETVLTGKAISALLMLGLVGLIALALAQAFRQATFAARESERSRTFDGDEEEPGMGRRLLERLGLFRQWRAAASVRRIYRLMSRAAAAAGYPRLEAETPYEYLPSLARVWPEHTAESRLITEAYVRVRYGEAPETAEELAAIRAAWRGIETAAPNRRDEAGNTGPILEKTERG